MVRGWLIWSVFVLAIAGCGEDKLERDTGTLQPRESSLNFGGVFIGASHALPLHFDNQSRSPQRVTVKLEGPYTVSPAHLEVGAGGTGEVQITFTPTSVGRADSSAELVLDPNNAVVSLLGVGLADQQCSTPPLCHALNFDPQAGVCVDSLIPDGTECTDDCTLEGHCASGVCIGTLRDCSDTDPCTLDSCEPGIGCVNRTSILACPTSTNPCMVPVCNSQSGCGFTPVRDGTSCGPADCTTANVCVAGVCTLQNVPEGSPCGSDSPCQAKGTCQGQQCNQAAPAVQTQIAWEQPVPVNSVLHFLALADAQGNVYWAEHQVTPDGSTVQIFLVSATPNGFLRYRKQIASYPDDGYDETMKIVGTIKGNMILLFDQPSHLDVFDIHDGSWIWGHDFSELVPQFYHPDQETGHEDVHLMQFVDDGVQLAVSAMGVTHDTRTDHMQGIWIYAMDWTSGAVNWTWTTDGRPRRLLADEYNNLYLSAWQINTSVSYSYANGVTDFATLTDGQLLSMDSTGAIRWQQANTLALDVANDQDRLYIDLMRNDPRCLVDQVLAHAGNGEVSQQFHTQLPWAMFVYDWPMLSGERAYRLAVPEQESCSGGETDNWFRSYDWFHSDEVWNFGQNLRANFISAPALNQDGSVLFAASVDGGSDYELHQIEPDGGDGFSCPIEPFISLTEPIVEPGLWVEGFDETDPYSGVVTQKVIAYPVGSLQPATSGWVGNRANMQRSNRPLTNDAMVSSP